MLVFHSLLRPSPRLFLGDLGVLAVNSHNLPSRERFERHSTGGEARHAYEIAIGLERDPAVRRFLQQLQSSLVADYL